MTTKLQKQERPRHARKTKTRNIRLKFNNSTGFNYHDIDMSGENVGSKHIEHARSYHQHKRHKIKPISSIGNITTRICSPIARGRFISQEGVQNPLKSEGEIWQKL